MPNQTPGILWTHFQNAILITIPVSAILLVWYRRAVSRNMRVASDAEPEVVAAPGPDDVPEARAVRSMDLALGPDSIDQASNESRSRRRVMVIYGVGGAVASLVLTALFFMSPDLEPAALRVFTVWYAFWWPVVPTIAALLAVSRPRAFLMFLVYVAAGAVAIGAWSTFNRVALGRTAVMPLANVVAFLTFLLSEAWLPYLIVLITGNRRLRSVSPLALAGLLVFSFSAFVVQYAVIALMDLAPARTWLLGVAGANVGSVLFLVAALPVGLACWWGLRALGRGYEHKSFSDVQLVVDTWWLIVIFDVVVMSATDLGWRALFGLLAWVAYRLTVEVLLRAWPISSDAAPAPRLLLLRVFGFQRRTERLFDGIAQRWRFRGTATLIAGTDLVSRLIDPGDVISFVGGHLKRQFVQGTGDMNRHLRLLDRVRDPDGRFRVTKFFCFDDTWRPTLQALIERSDIVLMDLRGFSARNSGCQFELKQLTENALLAKTVFVVDDSTDSGLLEASILEARSASTNAARGPEPHLNLVHTKRQSGADIGAIYRALRACE